MKVSFVSLFAFAGIFAGALAAPAAGAAPADTAAIEKRDVISSATQVVQAGTADVRNTATEIQGLVADVLDNTVGQSEALDTIENVLLPDLIFHIGDITTAITNTVGLKLRARQTDGLADLADAVAEIVTIVFNTLTALRNIVNLTTGSLGTVIQTLASTLSTLLTTVVGLNGQLSDILTGLVGGTLNSLNTLLNGLLNSLAGLLPGLLPGIL
ncbi:hypothetical protein BKA81DRAFT_435636 [Phyllosticta paracitricarpa]|uniref:Uncharacterized protein n=1 Tax=Phyllosticta citricarpa TaxID=55181 RepID=A0ABR1MRJ3_9PEZI